MDQLMTGLAMHFVSFYFYRFLSYLLVCLFVFVIIDGEAVIVLAFVADIFVCDGR